LKRRAVVFTSFAERAGKRKSGTTRKGARWLRATLVVAAQAAGRSNDTALGARDRALAARRGKQRAAVAVGHAILRAVYYSLADQHPYDERLQQPKPPRPASPALLVEQLRALGCAVAIQPLDPAA
jgi:hypothetical protein